MNKYEAGVWIIGLFTVPITLVIALEGYFLFKKQQKSQRDEGR